MSSSRILDIYNGEETEIIIPEGIKKIGDSAFSGGTNRTITMESTTPPTIGNSVFYIWSGSSYTRTIRVPSSALSTYKSATNWSKYADIIVGY